MPNITAAFVGAKIKELRLLKGLTQKELGAKLHVSQAMIGQYEKGERNAKIETLQKIAKALNASLSDLLDSGQSLKEYSPEDGVWDTLTKKADGTLERTIQTQINLSSLVPSPHEQEAIQHLRNLNTSGQKEALKRLEELTLIPKYTSVKEPPTP